MALNEEIWKMILLTRLWKSFTTWCRWTWSIWPWGYKTFSMFNSAELSMKFILLINVKMPTIVGILTFIRMIKTTSERLKARNFFICRYFSFYEQLKFRAQLSWAWKKFYNLRARSFETQIFSYGFMSSLLHISFFLQLCFIRIVNISVIKCYVSQDCGYKRCISEFFYRSKLDA